MFLVLHRTVDTLRNRSTGALGHPLPSPGLISFVKDDWMSLNRAFGNAASVTQNCPLFCGFRFLGLAR